MTISAVVFTPFSFVCAIQDMTNILEDIAAAISSGNTKTSNVIIWTNSKAPWFKKRSSCGHHSRRRFSSRKKQRTPMSKDTAVAIMSNDGLSNTTTDLIGFNAPTTAAKATLFENKSSGDRSSRRRHSRRKKQKHELTSEVKSNDLLVNKAPPTKKHHKGPFFRWGPFQ